MKETESGQGTCLCRKVTIRAKRMDTNLGACHCSMCRTWCAGPFLTVDCGSEVTIDGTAFLGVFDSSQWAERGFCKNCGTSLFYRIKETQQHIVSSEIFNETELKFDHQVFIDEKPSYYEFSNETENLTGKEVFEKYS